MVQILDGKVVSQFIRDRLKAEIKELSYTPHLCVIQLGKDDQGSNLYVKFKKKAAEEVGMKSSTYELPIDTTQVDLIAHIKKLNEDNDVDGILVQMPLPKHINTWEVIKQLNYLKDVDGFHPINNWALDNKLHGLFPCTPRGVITLLSYYHIPFEGSHVVIVNRSHLVGNPLLKLFRKYNATVTQCHSKTRNLGAVAKTADILVVATGNPSLVTENWVTEKSVVIDVSSPKGDCHDHFDAIKNKVQAITPVPGGIGPMTIACLLENTLQAAIERRKL
jgi:methylenetetrahydrofolate dehydrogenase (NADP+)/methenyltetrahydrofolate cyclohydrolase